MKKPFGGSMPGLYTPKKRKRARFKPYSEDDHYQQVASGLALFQISLHRKPIGLGLFDYQQTRIGQSSQPTTLIAANKLLGSLWTNWSKQ